MGKHPGVEAAQLRNQKHVMICSSTLKWYSSKKTTWCSISKCSGLTPMCFFYSKKLFLLVEWRGIFAYSSFQPLFPDFSLMIFAQDTISRIHRRGKMGNTLLASPVLYREQAMIWVSREKMGIFKNSTDTVRNPCWNICSGCSFSLSQEGKKKSGNLFLCWDFKSYKYNYTSVLKMWVKCITSPYQNTCINSQFEIKQVVFSDLF